MSGERLRVALACAALSAAVVVPFHLLGRHEAGSWLAMPATHDVAMHFDHMRAFWRGLAAGRLYPRWDDETNRGLGSPALIFHPPAIYYLTSLVHLATPSWGSTFLVTDLLVMIASGAALYRYARAAMSGPAAGVAMAAYLVLPYHLLDLYHRGAMAELLAFVWMPLVWLFTEECFATSEPIRALRAVIGLALVYAAFLWSHPPTAVQFGLATGVIAMLLALRRRSPGGLIRAGLGAILAFGLSAAYVLPAIAEQDLVRNDIFLSAWPYSGNYVFAPHPPEVGGFWGLVDGAWVLGALGVLVTATPLLVRASRGGLRRELTERVILWTAAGGFVTLMMTQAAAPLERLIPGLVMTSFPWRMLTGSTLVVALLAGACAEVAAQGAGTGRHARAFAGVAAAVVLGGAVFSIVGVAAPLSGAPPFTPRANHPTADVFWMRPKWTPESAKALPSMERAVLAGGRGRLTVERWDPEYRVLAADLSAPDRLSVRTFDFPGWTATLDGRPATIERGAALGEIELELPAGRGLVTLEFRPTPPRRLGVALSLASLLVVAGLAARVARQPGRPAGPGLTPDPRTP